MRLRPRHLRFGFGRLVTAVILASSMTAGRADSPPAGPGPDVRVNQDRSDLPQVGATIAVNPLDPASLVATWIDFFVTDQAVTDPVGYAWSGDGGRTWRSAQIAAPGFQGGIDPIVAADESGRFHIALGGLHTNPDQPALVGLLLFSSTDGGATFPSPVVVDPLPSETPALASDPETGALYVVYTGNVDRFGRAAILFRKSPDHGATFSPAVILGDGGTKGILSRVTVGPGGEVYVVWSNLFRELIFFQRSIDGGRTWLRRPVVVNPEPADLTPPFQSGLYAPLIPVALGVDRSRSSHRGRVYVAWGDKPAADHDIFLSHSDDRGSTFSAPVRVNDDPEGNLADQWFPSLAVDDAGGVQVTFFDRRDDPERVLYGIYLATSTDGGASFGPNVRVSDGIHGPGDFGWLGAYAGLAIGGGLLHPVWPDARFGDLDIFTHTVDLSRL